MLVSLSSVTIKNRDYCRVKRGARRSRVRDRRAGRIHSARSEPSRWGVGRSPTLGVRIVANELTAIITDVKYRMSPAIIRDLGKAGVRIVACHREELDSTPPLGFYSKFVSERHILPGANYQEELYDLCRALSDKEGRRPALLPVGAATLAMLAAPEARARFNDVCGLHIPSTEQLELLNDKGRVAELAIGCGVPVPASYSPAKDEQVEAFFRRVPLPCVIKPHWGEGLGLTAALRYVIARTPEELSQNFEHFSKLAGEAPIVQEYLPGTAMGCSVLAQNGAIIRSICHQRIREYPVTGGPSTCCDAICDPRLEEIAAILAEAVGLNGLAMFEFKNDSGDMPRLLEVNPRIWGSYPLTRAVKSDFSYTWFALSWNAGNPGSPLPIPAAKEHIRCRMIFFPSDIAAARGYSRAGKSRLARGAYLDLLRPGVKDGLFEWGDMRPALKYWRSLLKRR